MHLLGSDWLWPLAEQPERVTSLSRGDDGPSPAHMSTAHHARTLYIAAGRSVCRECAVARGRSCRAHRGGYVHASHLVEQLRGYVSGASKT